jgi:predicted HTH transcriptional regulator
VWWHDGEMVTFKNETTINILKKMVENPKVTIVELAKLLGLSENAIQKQLKNLQEKGYLQRNGKTRGGSWQVLLVSTT